MGELNDLGDGRVETGEGVFAAVVAQGRTKIKERSQEDYRR